MAIPTNVKEVRGLIGMASFYRRYEPNFSAIIRPLTRLTKKNVEFEWDPRCQEAFETVTSILSQKPVLSHPRMDRDFIVYTDASNVAIGAVLMQEDEERPHVLHYLSSALTPTQGRWPIREREAWAVIFAIRRFKPYMYGAKFVVRTDHKPLEYLFRSEIKNVKVQKWAMELSEYNCTIEYITGARNI